MKQKFLPKLLLAAILLLSSLCASAADFLTDGIYYNVVSSTDLTCEVTYYSAFSGVVSQGYYVGNITIPEKVTRDSNGNTYTVIGIGREAFCYSNITEITIPTTVTYIDTLAFYNCSALKEITIPRTVTSIGGSAFYGCSALTEIEIPSGVDIIHTYTFSGCSSLTKVSIPSSVTSIWEFAFNGCSSLSDVTIPSGVTSIWGSAFYDCTSLSELTIPSSVTSIGNRAFYNCSKLATVTLEDGEETLAMTTSSSYTPFSNCKAINALYLGRNISYTDTYSPFRSNTALSSLSIGNKVTSIGTCEFNYCTALENVDLPNSVTEIGENAFSGCAGLTSLTLGNRVEKIGAKAFSQCHGLIGQLKIPDSVTEIGENAFSECAGLTSLTLGNRVEKIGDFAFYYCRGLTGELKIPDSMTTIGDYVFSSCSKLTSLVLGNNVISIGSGAFSSCSSLIELTIPNSVISIGSSAFSSCSSLIELTIPNSVNEIGSSAFYNCTGLKKIISLAVTPPTIYDSTFDEDKEVEVPKESLTKYALTSVWSDFDLIYSISEGDYYYPVPIIRVGDALVAAEGGDENGVALKNGETATIKLIEDGEINGLVLFVSEDITETLSSKGSYSFTVEKYHKNNTIYSYSYTYNLTVSQAGDVLNQITVANINSVYSLKIKGDINGTDILTIRRMPNLQILDLSEANIVSGGDYYYNNSYATSDNCVGDYFFYMMDLLRYVKLPSNVKSIGNYAFGSCTSLTTIAIPNSVTSIGSNAFRSCSMLIDLTIGESVTSIGSSAFYTCTSLTDVTIPDKVISIEESAFRNCTKLTEIIIPASVESIGYRAFMGCTKLTTLTLVDGIEDDIKDLSLDIYYVPGINGYSASSPFDGCPLETIYMGRNVTFNSQYTVDGDIVLFSPFQNMGTLTTLTISDGVERIPSYLFYKCTGLTEITIPSSVYRLSWTAFNGCSNLKSITFEDGNRTLSISPDESDIYTSPSFEYCESLYLGRNLSYSNSYRGNNDCYSPFALVTTLNSVTIGNSVNTIPDYLFYKCTGITSLAIGSQVTSMGSSAFYNCTGLTEVKTPNSINSIGDSAFYGCSKVTTLTIGNGCSSIGSNAFYNCSKLVAIYAKAVTPPEISSDTFKGVDKTACTLYVPIGSINPYWLHAYWSEFYNIVEMYFDDSDGIETVGIITEEKEVVGYYSIDGKQLNAPKKGVNILRYSDGTTKKVLVK